MTVAIQETVHDTTKSYNAKDKLPFHMETTNIVSRTPSANAFEKNLKTENKTNKRSQSTKRTSVPSIKVIKSWNILKLVLSTLNGKDKLAKILKCIIDIYIQFFGKSLFINGSNNRINLLFISKQLGFFRYALRFGTLPFKLVAFTKKLWDERKNLKSLSKDNDGFGKGNQLIQDLIDIYYCTFDELNFTYKLNLLNDQKFFQTVSKHEAWAWQLDILNSIKNNTIKLNEQQLKLSDCNIKLNTIEITQTKYLDTNDEITSRLRDDLKLDEQFKNLEHAKRQLTHEIRMTKLDLYRLTMDFFANTTDVFQVERYLPRATYSILSLFSGCIGFYKTIIDKTNSMQQEY